MNQMKPLEFGVPDTPVLVPVEAYVSEDYARQEGEKLWGKVWQMACREEEIPKVGDYLTYDIVDESIILTRTSADEIKAFYNVCPHRGRRLTAGCGHTKQFFCRFHGWRWNVDGENAFVLDKEDWGGALTDERLNLHEVKIGRWAGYVFINLDPDCEPFESFLGTLPFWLDPFEIGKMRYRWRQWLRFPCNWKVALEAFNEGYHVGASHPQILQWGDGHTFSRAEGKHSCFGNVPRQGVDVKLGGSTGIDGRAHKDARKAAGDFMAHLWETVGLGACTTPTFVEAGKKLTEVLPESASAGEVNAKLMELACEIDAKRGVQWPLVDPEHFMQSGIDWHIFPNCVVLHGITFLLGYRARPDGHDPNSCIFEVYFLERFPEGQEPPLPENVYQPDITEEKWQLVLCQDFQNMPEVQRGMKSRGFRGAMPNPLQEKPVINFHRNLAAYMDAGAPELLDK
jgi:nitrite reductase/ring-hydroxylating ferredoxin subunit